MARRQLITKVAVPDEYIVDDGSGDLVVSVPCQDERHQVRLTRRGQLTFDHHEDASVLALAGEAAALAKEPQFVRCAEILLVWRYWRDMAAKFPGASRTFGLPQALIDARGRAYKLREDRAKYRAAEERRIHREHSTFMNAVYRRVREYRGTLTTFDRRPAR